MFYTSGSFYGSIIYNRIKRMGLKAKLRFSVAPVLKCYECLKSEILDLDY